MLKLTASFDDLEWEASQPGVREKKINIGTAQIRQLELTDELDHPEWCLTGHYGTVMDGSFVLDINGVEHTLNKGDVFVVEGNKQGHRHIPKVSDGGKVRLLLFEKVENSGS